jgi:hypothetical protein
VTQESGLARGSRTKEKEALVLEWLANSAEHTPQKFGFCGVYSSLVGFGFLGDVYDVLGAPGLGQLGLTQAHTGIGAGRTVALDGSDGASVLLGLLQLVAPSGHQSTQAYLSTIGLFALRGNGNAV